MMRLAAIDIGTNSVRLLVAELSATGIKQVKRELRTTRLGAGLMQSGCLSRHGKEATVAAVLECTALARSLGAQKLRLAGTSAMREASDGHMFARDLGWQAGEQVEVLSPVEEALLSYEGAAKSLRLPREVLVFDLGGGSCELIWPGDGSLCSASVKLGAVYLTEMFIRHDPPLTEELQCIRQHAAKLLSRFTLSGMPVIGIGGTVTSLAAMELQMAKYDAEQVHGFTLTAEMVSTQLQRLLAVPINERSQISGVQPARSDILPAGALVVEEILAQYRATSFTVSEGDILTGLIYSLI
jgi:exopolyphosphatase/guanosine-5'-triphosphate,3'-diphosphate pyrophosphatase